MKAKVDTHDGKKREFVSHADVMGMARWLEAGFGIGIQFHMRVACPKGEIYDKEYWEVTAHDLEGRQMATPRRVLASYPRAANNSITGVWLAMLWELEGTLYEVLPWVEPTVKAKPPIVER